MTGRNIETIIPTMSQHDQDVISKIPEAMLRPTLVNNRQFFSPH